MNRLIANCPNCGEIEIGTTLFSKGVCEPSELKVLTCSYCRREFQQLASTLRVAPFANTTVLHGR
jgi:hypothetical protein